MLLSRRSPIHILQPPTPGRRYVQRESKGNDHDNVYVLRDLDSPDVALVQQLEGLATEAGLLESEIGATTDSKLGNAFWACNCEPRPGRITAYAYHMGGAVCGRPSALVASRVSRGGQCQPGWHEVGSFNRPTVPTFTVVLEIDPPTHTHTHVRLALFSNCSKKLADKRIILITNSDLPYGDADKTGREFAVTKARDVREKVQ